MTHPMYSKDNQELPFILFLGTSFLLCWRVLRSVWFLTGVRGFRTGCSSFDLFYFVYIFELSCTKATGRCNIADLCGTVFCWLCHWGFGAVFRGLMTVRPIDLIPSTRRTLRSFTGRIVVCSSVPRKSSRITTHVNSTSTMLLDCASQVGQCTLRGYPGIGCVNVYYSLCSPRDTGMSVHCTGRRKVAMANVHSCNSRKIMRCIVDRLMHYLRKFKRRP